MTSPVPCCSDRMMRSSVARLEASITLAKSLTGSVKAGWPARRPARPRRGRRRRPAAPPGRSHVARASGGPRVEEHDQSFHRVETADRAPSRCRRRACPSSCSSATMSRTTPTGRAAIPSAARTIASGPESLWPRSRAILREQAGKRRRGGDDEVGDGRRIAAGFEEPLAQVNQVRLGPHRSHARRRSGACTVWPANESTPWSTTWWR